MCLYSSLWGLICASSKMMRKGEVRVHKCKIRSDCAGHDFLIWSIFLLLSFMHIYANIKAARSLQLTSLNPARLDILLANHVATQVRVSPTLCALYCQQWPFHVRQRAVLYQGCKLTCEDPAVHCVMGARFIFKVCSV